MNKTPQLEAVPEPDQWAEAARLEAEALKELAAMTGKPEDVEALLQAAEGAEQRHDYRMSAQELPKS